MEISFKEIVLKRLTFKDIELLRKWRNSKIVSENMFFQEKISVEMQQKWFESLSAENDFYFIIEYNQEPIGLINIKDIDWIKKQGEAGLFVGVEKFRNTHLAIYASLGILQYFFEERQLEKILAKVKKGNIDIIKYNQSLGFEKVDAENYLLTIKRYNSFTNNISQKLR